MLDIQTYITGALSWPVSTHLEKRSTFPMQTEELQEMQAEWKQEYRVRRQMLIERAKVCRCSASA